MEVWARLACLAIAVAVPAHAFQAASQPPFALRQSRGSACSLLSLSLSAANGDGERNAARQDLSRRAFAVSAAIAIPAMWVAPAQAGTVMVGGEAVAAEEELDDVATAALEGAGGGPLDWILAKVNVKKLGFWGVTFLVADTASGLVMGKSFFKIVSGKEDPEDWKTKVVDKYFGKPGEGETSLPDSLVAEVNGEISGNKVMVFSKTSCPFCKNAKAALDAQGIAYKAIELDARADGQQIQDIMLQMTGARSVPRVFVNGKFVGGGDDTCALAASGKLKALVEAE